MDKYLDKTATMAVERARQLLQAPEDSLSVEDSPDLTVAEVADIKEAMVEDMRGTPLTWAQRFRAFFGL